MNNINFNQSVGFPLETEILAEMQKAYTLLNALGAIVGDKTIISGCELTNTTVSDGVIYLNGEILEFKSGILDTHIIISETKTALEFEDTITRDVIYTRQAMFGTATPTAQWLWSDFKRGYPTMNIDVALAAKATNTDLTALVTRVVALEARPAGIPAGTIAIWGQAANLIPAGWAEYTPLRGRIPAGLDPSYVFSTSGDRTDYQLNTLGYGGGKREHQLSEGEMPVHDHDVRAYLGVENRVPAGGSGSNGGNFDLTTSTAGGNLAHTNMSPYRVVHYMIKL